MKLFFDSKLCFSQIFDSLSIAHNRMHDFTDFRRAKFHEISRNFTKFEYNTSVDVAMNPFEKEFGNFPVRDRFSKKNAKIEMFSTFCDCRLP